LETFSNPKVTLILDTLDEYYSKRKRKLKIEYFIIIFKDTAL